MTAEAKTAKEAATEEYLALYEYHCEREQLERDGAPPMLWCVHAGRDGWDPRPEDRATDHHNAALQVLWSMDAEAQDPQPPGLRKVQ
jgi:hypothetical protein